MRRTYIDWSVGYFVVFNCYVTIIFCYSKQGAIVIKKKIRVQTAAAAAKYQMDKTICI